MSDRTPKLTEIEQAGMTFDSRPQLVLGALESEAPRDLHLEQIGGKQYLAWSPIDSASEAWEEPRIWQEYQRTVYRRLDG
ncbi:MAG: hypothetical protein DLM70_18535, partial [Chloroflexi bacterium]